VSAGAMEVTTSKATAATGALRSTLRPSRILASQLVLRKLVRVAMARPVRLAL
jgi:hypothetical protein